MPENTKRIRLYITAAYKNGTMQCENTQVLAEISLLGQKTGLGYQVLRMNLAVPASQAALLFDALSTGFTSLDIEDIPLEG